MNETDINLSMDNVNEYSYGCILKKRKRSHYCYNATTLGSYTEHSHTAQWMDQVQLTFNPCGRGSQDTKNTES